MADGKNISWPYTRRPFLGIRIKTFLGKEFPVTNEELVAIDTGFTGDILIPKEIYKELKLEMWEKPELDKYKLGDKSKVYLVSSYGYILIPKLDLEYFCDSIYRFFEIDKDVNKIIIGTRFIKRFKLLLNGPENKVCIK